MKKKNIYKPNNNEGMEAAQEFDNDIFTKIPHTSSHKARANLSHQDNNPVANSKHASDK